MPTTARPAASLPSRLVAATVWVVLVLGPLTGWGIWRHAIDDDRAARFGADVTAARTEVQHELGHHEAVLRATAAVFDASAEVTGAEFDAFARRYLPEQDRPALYAVSYVRAVAEAAVPAYQAEMARQRRPVPLALARGTADHFIVTYERSDSPVRAVGQDLAADRTVRTAAERARDTGTTAITGPLRLADRADDVVRGFGLLAPVYRPGLPLGTVQQRRAALTGLVQVVIRSDRFLASVTTAGDPALALYADPADVPIAATPVPDGEPWRSASTELAAFGRTLRLRVDAQPGAYHAGRVAAADLVLAGGLLAGMLVGSALWLLARAEQRARRRADETAATLRENEARFRTLVAAAPVGIFQTDTNGGPIYLNPTLREIVGVEDDLTGPAPYLVHPDDLDRLATAWEASGTQDEPVTVRFRIVRDDGDRWLSARISALRDAAGNLVGRIGSVDDIQDETDAQLRNDRLTAIVEATTDLVTICDGDGAVVWANDAALRFHGFAGTAEAGDHRLVYPPHARSFFQHEVLPAVRAHGVWSGETSMLDAAGREVPVSQVVLSHGGGDDGGPFLFSSIARDLSERHSFEQRLVHEKLHDPLTGLSNRALFLDRLQQALARAEGGDRTVAVAFLDVDRFKVVNDSLGHDAGDELLVAVGRRLTDVLRGADSAARFNADEFVLLDEDVRSEDEVMALADLVREAFANPFEIAGRRMHVTACLGVAVGTAAHRRPEDLLRDANAALSRAKEKGPGQIEVFDEALRQRAMRRLELGSALHRAVERGELRVHYQPEVSLVDGSLTGLEALVRWQHPREGMLGPTEFIPIAEENGLIDEIGEFVLGEVCWQAARWNRARVAAALPPVTVWCNLSARQLARPDLVERVAAILSESGADASCIGLEITESTLFDDVDAAVETLTRLRGELGVRLGVDDFGTGWSSLTYLKRLPVEMIKIDRSFVDGVGTDAESTAIVAAVISMARALGLVVVAEGAETAAQVTALRTLGCGVAQGYYFAAAQPRQVVDGLLRNAPEQWASAVAEPLKAPPASTVAAAVPRQRAPREDAEESEGSAIIL